MGDCRTRLCGSGKGLWRARGTIRALLVVGASSRTIAFGMGEDVDDLATTIPDDLGVPWRHSRRVVRDLDAVLPPVRAGILRMERGAAVRPGIHRRGLH